MELWQLGCKVRCRVSGISAFYLKLCVLPTPKQTNSRDNLTNKRLTGKTDGSKHTNQLLRVLQPIT